MLDKQKKLSNFGRWICGGEALSFATGGARVEAVGVGFRGARSNRDKAEREEVSATTAVFMYYKRKEAKLQEW